jgi:hypothetical protein
MMSAARKIAFVIFITSFLIPKKFDRARERSSGTQSCKTHRSPRMGTPPASASVDQMRRAQITARIGGECAEKSVFEV